jgi:hypothetical protein
MLSPFVESEIRQVALQRNLDPAMLLAIVEVESGGRAFTEIGGRLMPLILFEYHVFHRQLRPGARKQAVGAGLASPRWGQLPYPRSQRERYALLARAKLIDREAAYAACSWGVGQVLGENARWLGYESAEAMADEASSGIAGQVSVMLRFIARRGLESALARRDWVRFAEGYLQARMTMPGAWRVRMPNGQGPAPETVAPLLAIGACGAHVQRLQEKLIACGAHSASMAISARPPAGQCASSRPNTGWCVTGWSAAAPGLALSASLPNGPTPPENTAAPTA